MKVAYIQMLTPDTKEKLQSLTEKTSKDTQITPLRKEKSKLINEMQKLGIPEESIYIENIFINALFDCPIYLKMKESLQTGDTLFLCSTTFMGYNFEILLREWLDITQRIGADVVAIDNPLFDSRRFKTQDATGKALEKQFIDMLTWVAKEQRNSLLLNQRMGIIRAKEMGLYKGRKPTGYDCELFEQLYKGVSDKKQTARAAMRKFGVSSSTWYKLVKEYENKEGRWEKTELL